MTPREYLLFVGRMKGLKGTALLSQIEEVMEQTRISDVRDRIIRNLSKGYRQRVGVAQALLGHPEVIILDEPTVGLDPKQIIEIRDLIRELGKTHTVVLSSHILSEVRSVCDVIIIISKGKMVAVDTPENLEQVFAGEKTLELTVKGTAQEVESVLKGLEKVKKTSCVPAEDGRTKVSIVTVDDTDISEAVFQAFSQKQLPIVSMTTAGASLEDVFIELTGDNGKEEETHDSDI
jgi:ABC-2 type transport system ATP-binding protein